MDLYLFTDLISSTFLFFLIAAIIPWIRLRPVYQPWRCQEQCRNPPACHYKTPPRVHMVRTASLHGRYRNSAALVMVADLVPSKEKTKRSHEGSIADVSFLLGHCQESWTDRLDMRALVPACRLDYVDTRDLDLASMWVTECE